MNPIGADGLGMCGGPNIGKQAFQIWLALGQSLEYIMQIGPHVQVVSGGARHHGEQNGGAVPGLRTTNKEPIASADGQGPQVTLRRIVGDRQAGVEHVGGQRLPLLRR